MSARKVYADDDGRTIASMDIDGMPWHNGRRRREKAAVKETQAIYSNESGWSGKHTFSAILAGVAVWAVFTAVFGLFIAFCVFVLF